MKLLLLLGQDERFFPVATEAARLVDPATTVKAVAHLEDALATPESGEAGLLVALGAATADAIRAAQILDSKRLPRWEVLSAGQASADFAGEKIFPEDWEPARVARIFRTALARHRLIRENGQLRGDILSIGTRITHDLRTPLAGIFATCDSLNEVLATEAPACVPLIQPIMDSAQDLMKLVHKLSLMTKATAGRTEHQPYDMGVPVLTAMERHGRLAAERQATIGQPDAWPEMTGDVGLVAAVWGSLIENALRHAGEQPQIELGWSSGPGEKSFFIRDRGTGVPLEKRGALFQSFHLLHEPNAPRGLGLPIVQRLVQLQGGRCGYEPGIPTGSVFFFTLPDTDGRAGAAPTS